MKKNTKPSFNLLYFLEAVEDPAITVKVIGHQWYWSYEYSDYVTEKEDLIGSLQKQLQENKKLHHLAWKCARFLISIEIISLSKHGPAKLLRMSFFHIIGSKLFTITIRKK